MSDRANSVIRVVLVLLAAAGLFAYCAHAEAECDGTLVRGLVGMTCIEEDE